MKQRKLPKPRNPFVQHIVTKKQGAHQKSYKTERRDAKAALKRQDYSTKHIYVSLSSLIYGPLVEWFNNRFLIYEPGFDSQRVHQ